MFSECENIEIYDILEKNICVERAVSKKSPKLCALCGMCFFISFPEFSNSGTAHKSLVRVLI